MIDRLRQLAIFAKVVDHGSFRGAAKELNLSPSVISHHVSELESYLGVALIYRTTRKLTLSKEGERLLLVSNEMLKVVDEELKELSGNSSEPSGELRVTIPAILCQSSFTDAIASYAQKYPRVRLSLDYSDTSKELIDDGFDVAIRLWLKAKKSNTTKTLFAIERRLIASPEFIASEAAIVEPQQLENGKLLALSPVHDMGISFSNKTQGRVKIKPNARLNSNDAQSILRFAKLGLGVAALPELLVADDVLKGELKYVLSDWDLEPIIAFAEWPKNAPKKGLISLLVKELSMYNYKIGAHSS